MDIKEKLMGLLNGVLTTEDVTTSEQVASHLIAHGVIVPPMTLGRTCFGFVDYLNEVDEFRVSSITQKSNGTIKIRLTNMRGKWVIEITADNIGKTVFLTREEAERALEERTSNR